jgi:metal-responsive CopG/Arc/MetJ family transcriptional regulator
VKVKISLTLPGDVLTQIDRIDPNRSRFVEKAARYYFSQVGRAKRDERDAAILDAHAVRLNKEALDFLEYQNLD